MKPALLLPVALSLVVSMPSSSVAQKSIPVVGPILGVVTPQHDPACLVPFSNPNPIGIAYAQPDGELLDDLHMIGGFVGPASLCAFDIRIINFEAEPIEAEVNIYRNTPSDDAPGDVIAGPFAVTLPNGPSNVVHYEAASGIVEKDVWFGVKFLPEPTLYGWHGASVPTTGTSHDVIWNKGPGVDQLDTLENDYSNFFVTLYTSEPVQTTSSTWGKVKAIYR